MTTLSGSPFCWLEFDKKGHLVDSDAAAAAAALIAGPAITDVVVISHGWKNTKDDATKLYGTLWQNTVAAAGGPDPQHFAIIGVLWPAKAFSTDFDAIALADAAGGGALSADGAGGGDLGDAAFDAVVAEFSKFVDIDDPAVQQLLADCAAVRADGEIPSERGDRMRRSGAAAVGMAEADADPELRDDAAPYLDPPDPALFFSALTHPPSFAVDPDVGSAQGLGDTVSGLFNGARAAVARFLNQLTYFEMKKRAGVVGTALGKTVLPAIAPAAPRNLHLVGHSFGARLVTAAAAALPEPVPPKFSFASLTLLQGAFSHNALSKAPDGTPGSFKSVGGRPKGPIAITHTHNDIACTLAYALASRLSRDVANAVGDKNDAYGAMGANGAQGLPATMVAEHAGLAAFAPSPGKVNNLLADGFVVKTDKSDAHNNVDNADCGRVLAAVLAAT
ncbi:hypothetical protein [Methylobrevis albus]|uniref:Serine-threonine protein kinase n=1 Tax=Methylobrevis albus TaxID=2793297 RepID=A0A931HZ79_9HYPH|nr:hypothetical protein [Methylobrevis albus]MBH0237467.1 hypothetical protein [Methylobrevis albus]